MIEMLIISNDDQQAIYYFLIDHEIQGKVILNKKSKTINPEKEFSFFTKMEILCERLLEINKFPPRAVFCLW